MSKKPDSTPDDGADTEPRAASAEVADAAAKQTSIRIYLPDASDLKALAGLMDVSIPEAYRMVCSRVASAALAAKARERATAAERDARRPG